MTYKTTVQDETISGTKTFSSGASFSSNITLPSTQSLFTVVTSSNITDNSEVTILSSVHQKSFLVVSVFDALGNISSFPIFNNGGAGIGYKYTTLDSDTGWVVNAGGVDFSFVTYNSNTYTFKLITGTGDMKIQRTSGSSNYYVKIFYI